MRLAERNERICAMALSGETLQAVGDEFGMTRERVRQIVNAAGVPVADRLAAVREARRGTRNPTRRMTLDLIEARRNYAAREEAFAKRDDTPDLALIWQRNREAWQYALDAVLKVSKHSRKDLVNTNEHAPTVAPPSLNGHPKTEASFA